MSQVLGAAYRHLLQQATAVARLAEQQLAFERQAPMAGYIASDYWSPPAGSRPPGTAGLTGSTRLLDALTTLEQYAFNTNQRKLQLTQTFSLATLAPVDLERFRQTGVLPIIVRLDRWGAPGTYLATIRRVQLSVAALVPPAIGIRGTLTGGGTSHIVVNDNGVFRTEALTRLPETLVITIPTNANATFAVDLTPELLLLWEGCGLDLPFELRLPKAINGFDYRTVADVQLSVDYTALFSADYATQVIGTLPRTTSNSAAFRLSDDTDAWYDLNAQVQAASGGAAAPVLTTAWTVRQDDLPENLTDPFTVEQVTLLVLRDGATPAVFTIDHLRHDGLPATASTAATTVGDIVSTRNESGANWVNNLTGSGQMPFGRWELGLVATPDTVAAFTAGSVHDLMLVLGYSAGLPPWPTS